jgi:hypothetical protein
MIYLASPYTHTDPEVMRQRYELAFQFCASEMQKGVSVLSPIVYGHQFALRGQAQTDFLSWQKFNDSLLLRSAAVHVLMLNGWRDSLGIHHELEYAERLGLPIIYRSPV